MQSYSPPSQKIIINYTFSSVSRWYFPSFPRDLKIALPILHRLSAMGLLLTFFEVLQQPSQFVSVFEKRSDFHRNYTTTISVSKQTVLNTGAMILFHIGVGEIRQQIQRLFGNVYGEHLHLKSNKAICISIFCNVYFH